MNQQDCHEVAPEQPAWEAPELVKADVADATLAGVGPGVDGPMLKS